MLMYCSRICNLGGANSYSYTSCIDHITVLCVNALRFILNTLLSEALAVRTYAELCSTYSKQELRAHTMQYMYANNDTTVHSDR